MDVYDLIALPLRLITWAMCVALTIIALPLVIYLRAYDAVDASVDVTQI